MRATLPYPQRVFMQQRRGGPPGEGRGNRILQWRPPRQPGRQVRRRQQLEGLLNDYCRAA